MKTHCMLKAVLVALTIAVPSADSAAQYLYWRESSRDIGTVIKRSAVDGTGVRQLAEVPLSLGIGLDIDPVNGWLYWPDRAAGTIKRTDLSGCSTQDVITGLWEPLYVAVDATNGWIYWTQSENNPLEETGLFRARLDGSQKEQLIEDDIWALALDVDAGKIYFSNSAFCAGPSRANVDGTESERLIDSATMKNTFGVTGQVSIALDTLNGEMYFGAGEFPFVGDVGSIGRATLDGSNPEQVLVDELHYGPVGNPLGLALDIPNNRMYWANIFDQSIYSAALDGSDVQLLYTAVDGLTPSGLVIGGIEERTEACCIAETCKNLSLRACQEACGEPQGWGTDCTDMVCTGCTDVACSPDIKTNRYLRFVTPAVPDAVEEVIRVRVISLYGFDVPDPDVLYVGAPFQVREEIQQQPGLTFTAAPLQCEPHSHNWSGECLVSVYGAEIIPGSTYEIERASASCPDLETNEECWSEPLTITTAKYGDVWPPYEGPGSSPQPDMRDIAAMVRKFEARGGRCCGMNGGSSCSDAAACPDGSCDATAPIKAVCQLQPNCVFPDRPIDFKDIAATVRAFTGKHYHEEYFGPCVCPSLVSCGALTCQSDLDCPRVCEDNSTWCTKDQDCVDAGLSECSIALCVDNFCMDQCGRCTSQ